MRPLYIFYSICAVLSCVLVLDQIWIEVVDTELFWKLIITIPIIAGGALAVQLIRGELIEEKKQKGEGYLD